MLLFCLELLPFCLAAVLPCRRLHLRLRAGASQDYARWPARDAGAAAARGRARQPPRTDVPKPEPAKPDIPPVEAKPVEEPPRPPTTLQTTPPTAEGEVERLIRMSIAKANADLNRVDYRALNNDARNQYDTAKRFIRQADDAMRAKNLVFAKSVADKAAALAAQLAGR